MSQNMSFQELLQERQNMKNLMEDYLNKYQTIQKQYFSLNDHIIKICHHDFSNNSRFCKICDLHDTIMYRN